MNVDTLSVIATVVVFGVIGWRQALKRTRPARIRTFVLLVLAAVVGSYLGVGTRLLDVFGFRIVLAGALVSGCLGAALGLFANNRRLRRLAG